MAATHDALARIQRWYARQCDGEWEHGYGLNITTLDNPGWSVAIELTSTSLHAKPFEKVVSDSDSPRWLHCEIKDSTFNGAGGAEMLGEILTVFLDWAGAE